MSSVCIVRWGRANANVNVLDNRRKVGRFMMGLCG